MPTPSSTCTAAAGCSFLVEQDTAAVDNRPAADTAAEDIHLAAVGNHLVAGTAAEDSRLAFAAGGTWAVGDSLAFVVVDT